MIRRLTLSLSLSAVLAGGLAAAPALAAQPQAAALSSQDQALVHEAEAYLQNLKTVQGRFTQVEANGSTSTGTFYLQRPGKARFQYDPPADMLIVSDGYNVVVNDRRLKTFNQYPLGRTPLELLLAKEVRLDRGVTVTSVDQTPGGFSLTARDAHRRTPGTITVEFAHDPMALRGWIVVDAQGRKTHVTLGPLKPVSDLDPNLFVLRDPRARSGRP
jgi:outer membrane lipoprotein-sorting protein